MNHLEAVVKGQNSFWRYLVMLVVVFVFSNIAGSIPLFIIMGIKAATGQFDSSMAKDAYGLLESLSIGKNMGLFIMLFPFLIMYLSFAVLLRPLHNRNVATVINGGMPFRWRKMLLAALIWLIFMGGALYYSVSSDPGNFTFNPDLSELPMLILISLLFIPVQSAVEELVFRGYLMQGFSLVVRNRFFPLVVTSILFGLLHSVNPEVKAFGFWIMMPQYICFGLVFGIITIIDDGIEGAIGVHAINNIFLSIMVTTESAALQTGALFSQAEIDPWAEFLNMVIMSTVFLIVYKYLSGGKSFGMIFKKIESDEAGNQIP